MLPPGTSIIESDVRIGLTADAQSGRDAVIQGGGFQRLSSQSYVAVIENGGGGGSLRDGEGAIAVGGARHSLDLEGEVFAMLMVPDRSSASQVVHLTTTVLEVAEGASQARVEIDTALVAKLVGRGVAICEVEAEILLDGHPMGKVETAYYLYREGEVVAIYLGPRQLGQDPLATVANGGRFARLDPSFHFALGPGVYELFSTLKLSAACPAGAAGSAASLEAKSQIGLR